MTSLRVFLVTGSNKGVGKSIVKLLLQDKEEKIVYLTSRNEELGKQAVKDLEALGVHPLYHQLDISDRESIKRLRDHLVKQHGGLDVLVNNAGIAYKESSTVPTAEQAEVTNKVNFFGTLDVCEILYPILKSNARVSNVSSLVSEICYPMLSGDLQKKFVDGNLTIEGLRELINDYVTCAREGTCKEHGWPEFSYGVSKVGVTIMTKLHQKYFDNFPEKNILVNCCCPGIVETDMSGGKYPNSITPDAGADTPTYLALLAKEVKEPRGCFLKLKTVVSYPPQ